ncbi:hypothetical protein OS493_010728 [Desmophyllum pertusum]|uniref:Uncharacterized protein n=1 Tax=Desmophyllum pertusum TaxID=174260 RepID=A0A9W9ZUP2_9CNID|nr:hypothetical protein OS493_010728 [Desmophyllum pertusum]
MSLANSGPTREKFDMKYIHQLLIWQNQHLKAVQDYSVHLGVEIEAGEEANYIDDTILAKTLTQLEENEALDTLILAQWSQLRVSLERYANQRLDVNKQQEKTIDKLKKELDQQKDRYDMLLLDRDALLKKYHHPWVC